MPSTSGSLTASIPQPAASVGQMLLDRVAATPDREAYRAPVEGGGWRSLTWRQTGDVVTNLAAGLLALGLAQEERVAIASSTRLEWILADLAIMCAGGANTTVYPSTSADDVAFILSDSGTRFLIAENISQAHKALQQRDKLPRLEKIILIDGDGDGDDDIMISTEDLRALGAEHLVANPSAVADRIAGTMPDHLATLIYTSGTTGKPKGVELTHRCWTYEGAAVDAIDIVTIDDVHFLWLPLAHSFGKVLIALQIQVGFVTAVDGRVDKIVENLASVQPTLMAAVPRIFEKVYARVVGTTAAEGGVKEKIFNWAFDVGGQYVDATLEGRSPSPWVSAQHALADRLVFSKVKERLGGRIRIFVSGSAALSPEIAKWFLVAGLPILEGYGLTETSAATTIMRPERMRIGTVGEPFPGTEIRIADDGEILVRGPGVMRGYRNLPDQTAEVMLADDWFATGDVGEIDEQGRIRITDRKKDLVKTSGGKYIAPSAIESQFKALCGLASNMVVHAEGRNYATAMITLDPDALRDYGSEHGLPSDFAEASQSDLVKAEVSHAIEQLNGGLNRWETIKDFRILDRDFTIEDGELTPSLKVKRKVVETKFSDVFAEMYAG